MRYNTVPCRTVVVASCNKVLLKTVHTSAADKDTYIYMTKIRFLIRIVLWLITRAHSLVIFLDTCLRSRGPWMVPLVDYIGLRPPGSKERYSGLNPSPLGTRPSANFANRLFDNLGTSKYLQGIYRYTFVGTYRYLHVPFRRYM